MKKIEFVKAVYKLNELPKDLLPEIVLCGRSNVGKSSFINSLLNSKVAKTSSTPGKTRSINYYKVENKFYFVDLPGFGYAKVSKQERDDWKKLLHNFFELKRTTQVVFHLIDSRHEPMQTDIELNDFIHLLGLPYFVFLNKADKLNQKEMADSKRVAVKCFPELILGENLFHFSTVKGNGKKETLALIYRLFLS
ncbi:MAG: ribosome bioproteinis GTP-binding protein YsxC [Ignavibacteria bacterium]|nr:MAG: ribosome bioproteinis GTP-binding protein YsxC [Ignavibacteria bacterium]KAF0157265.1 MAG: ribosome bioproteinis GTP-binding protein YsxC [Ignavibacteria bacterium]